ncbi:MAG: hypothetical protein IBX50_09750 [Marinospirillum sp.]|uniref:hypothetical protein n=1 Tax=Marinospirillum sp. TaxID=2183934 RepID=UPI0019FE57E8|nr:hypothetical protein [Marinospirillum sp.]MBE0506986.1 hypothetical protein [Marinospirillum sp.]
MTRVELWGGFSNVGADVMLVPKQFEDDFLEFYDQGCFEQHPNHVYMINNFDLVEDDLDLLFFILSHKYGGCFTKQPRLIEFIMRYNGAVIYPGFSFGVGGYRAESRLASVIFKSFKEVIEKLDDFSKDFFLRFPHSGEDNWIVAPLSMLTNNSFPELNFYYDANHISGVYYKKVAGLRSVFEEYADLNLHEKICFISSYFLVKSEYLFSFGDITQAIVFLHRAVETLFISWLVEDRQLYINSAGEIGCDKYKYLMDYMGMVKSSRSISDNESRAIKCLNLLRNKCKYAHGYSYVDYSDACALLRDLSGLFYQDATVSSYSKSFKDALNLDDDFFNIIYIYLLESFCVRKL